MRITTATPIEAGQAFQIDVFRPQDAAGVANLFYSVYGPAYPVQTYYVPERIIEENRLGNLHSVIARTPKGDVVAHCAMFRSSPPFAGLLEIGQGVVLPDYRGAGALSRILDHLAEETARQAGAAGVFGEAVCNHLKTQKPMGRLKHVETALEVELMPHEAYLAEGSAAGRVSCILSFRSYLDRPQEIFVPEAYRQELAFLSSGLELQRTVSPGSAPVPEGSLTVMSWQSFASARVVRAGLESGGADFTQRLEDLEGMALSQCTHLVQVFLKLDSPWIGPIVDILRAKGYFLGGYLPRWFDADGLLMQRLAQAPDFSLIHLYSQRSQQILALVSADWQRATA